MSRQEILILMSYRFFKMIDYQKVQAFMWFPEANLFPIATYTMLN